MAERPIIETGEGFITEPATLESRSGQLTLQDLATAADALLEVVGALNGGLSLGTGQHASRAGNLSAQDVIVTFPAVADEEIEVPHGLGRKPVRAEVGLPDRACSVYASNVPSWTVTTIRLRCSVADAVVLIRLS